MGDSCRRFLFHVTKNGDFYLVLQRSQYFPKGTNFRNVTKIILALAVKKLNHRPRKCLNYQTPREVFYEAVSGALAT